MFKTQQLINPVKGVTISLFKKWTCAMVTDDGNSFLVIETGYSIAV